MLKERNVNLLGSKQSTLKEDSLSLSKKLSVNSVPVGFKSYLQLIIQTKMMILSA